MDTQAYLRAQGWKGQGHGTRATSLARPLLVSRHQGKSGLGTSARTGQNPFADPWWARSMDESLRRMGSIGGGPTTSTSTSRTDVSAGAEGDGRRKEEEEEEEKMQVGGRWRGGSLFAKYGGAFVQGESLGGTLVDVRTDGVKGESGKRLEDGKELKGDEECGGADEGEEEGKPREKKRKRKSVHDEEMVRLEEREEEIKSTDERKCEERAEAKKKKRRRKERRHTHRDGVISSAASTAASSTAAAATAMIAGNEEDADIGDDVTTPTSPTHLPIKEIRRKSEKQKRLRQSPQPEFIKKKKQKKKKA
ncbi:MAG: hypothetical protein M1825_000460 [Sarcosagium campestre]|nr:MAG: hypothetical protein M1825_000460 [Sarcosagium campestre]